MTLTSAIVFFLLIAQEAPPPEARKPAPPEAGPNLRRLKENNVVLNLTDSVQATDGSGRDAFQVDHYLTIRPGSKDEKYLFMMPSGELYDLRVEVSREDGTGKATLVLPDHSTVTLRFLEPKKGSITYGKNSMSLDVLGSHKEQFVSDKALQFRATLPDSGRQLVALLDHVRGDLCRQVSLCEGFAPALLDLFRDDKEIGAEIGPMTDNEDSGWKVRTLSSSRTVDPIAR